MCTNLLLILCYDTNTKYKALSTLSLKTSNDSIKRLVNNSKFIWKSENSMVRRKLIFLNSPKVIYVYFTRLVVATAIIINYLNLKKKRKLSYAAIKLKCLIDTVSYSYCFKLQDCEQSLLFFRFSKESARLRERRAAKPQDARNEGGSSSVSRLPSCECSLSCLVHFARRTKEKRETARSLSNYWLQQIFIIDDVTLPDWWTHFLSLGIPLTRCHPGLYPMLRPKD